MNNISIIQKNCQLQKTEQIKKSKDTVSFLEKKNTIAAETNYIPETTEYTFKEETFEEYKASIYSLLLSYSQNTSGNGGVFVDIPDECLLAMKSDKTYERWVLETIQKAYNAAPSYGYDTYTFLKFGTTKEEFSQDSYSFPDRRTKERLRKLQLEQREELKKKRKKMLEKKLLAEKWQKEACLAAYIQLTALDHKTQLQKENEAFHNGKAFQKEDHSSSIWAAAKRKANIYESTFLYSK